MAYLRKTDKREHYIQNEVLRTAFEEALDILGRSGKEVLLQELEGFGIQLDGHASHYDPEIRYSLEQISSALIEVVGKDSADLIMIRLTRFLKKFECQTLEDGPITYFQLCQNVINTITAVLGPTLGREMTNVILNEARVIGGLRLVKNEYFLIGNPEIFESAISSIMGQGSTILFQEINANLVREFCPRELKTFQYSENGDYARLVSFLKNKTR